MRRTECFQTLGKRMHNKYVIALKNVDAQLSYFDEYISKEIQLK